MTANSKLPIIVNLWSGPGAGKSTLASGIFHNLKLADIKCELVTEYAKELTYLGRREELKDQVWVSAVQEHRHWILRDRVDVIITDSPTGLGIAYAKEWKDGDIVRSFARHARKRYHNMDFWLMRNPDRPFQAYGRRERTVEEAIEKDHKVHSIMVDLINAPVHSVMVGVNACAVITETIKGAFRQ